MFLDMMSRQQSRLTRGTFIAHFHQINQRELVGIESEDTIATDMEDCTVNFRINDRTTVGIQKFNDVFEILASDVSFCPN